MSKPKWMEKFRAEAVRAGVPNADEAYQAIDWAGTRYGDDGAAFSESPSLLAKIEELKALRPDLVDPGAPPPTDRQALTNFRMLSERDPQRAAQLYAKQHVAIERARTAEAQAAAADGKALTPAEQERADRLALTAQGKEAFARIAAEKAASKTAALAARLEEGSKVQEHRAALNRLVNAEIAKGGQ